MPYQYTDGQNIPRTYKYLAAALFIERGEHITVRGCTITGSGNGLFVASGDSEEVLSRDILVENCSIHGNGNIGRDREHNVYTEAIGITFQYNYFGPPRPGAGGNNLKDRSAGTVIRYNWIEGGAHLLDLVEAQESFSLTGKDPRYRRTLVEGNVLLDGPADATNLVHYGGDSGIEGTYRKGILHFTNNTVVIQCDQTGSRGRWRTTLFKLETNDEVVEARNNVFFYQAATAESSPTELTLLDTAGNGYFRVNWISPGWVAFHATKPSGANVGTDSFRSNSTNTPGFQDLVHYDLHLTPRSPCRGMGVPTEPDVIARAREKRKGQRPVWERKANAFASGSKREIVFGVLRRTKKWLILGVMIPLILLIVRYSQGRRLSRSRRPGKPGSGVMR